MQEHPSKLTESQLQAVLRRAAADIAESGTRHVRSSRRRGVALAAAITVCALLAGAGTGFAFGRSGGLAPASHTGVTHTMSTSPLPRVVQAALQTLLQERNPQIVQRVDSVEVKYVTDRQFQNSVSSAWKTDQVSACGSSSAPDAVAGHWYLILLHGRFINSAGPGIPTTYTSALLIQVPDTDLIAHLPVPSLPPGVPKPATVGTGPGMYSPPLGHDGEPLCWSLLPSS